MSRIGKQLIIIPDKVEAKIDGDFIVINGPKGELKQQIHRDINIEIKDKEISIKPRKEGKEANSAIWGTFRALVANMVKGVSDGFEKKMIFEGVGYKALVNGNKLVLNLGFSHQIEIEAPKSIQFKVDKNIIVVSGSDKQLVGQIAANIREKRKPEPYKGKGIRYEKEIIRRKTGKKAATASS